MARILIGSSNVYRFYEANRFKRFDPYIMVNCTKSEIFAVKMAELGPEDKEIVISVIENFVCDAVSGVEDNMVATGLCERAIKEYFGTIKTAADRLPESRIALAQPILRPGNDWYASNFDVIIRCYIKRVNTITKTNITKLKTLSLMS